MIKRFNKILAGITAAAALLLAAGCKNQLDYLNDTTARNAFNVAGLYVSGLDAGYNGANVALKVVAVDANGDKSEVDYVAGTVADSYTTDKGETVGHQSGTVYIKLDEAKLYDGDKMAVDYFNANSDADDYVAFSASSIECYLQVGSDKFQVLSSDGTSFENAKLSVPTSEAGTSDADLLSRWVTVTINDGTATFALASSVKEPKNVTLYCISGVDLVNTASASALPAGVTVDKLTATACTTSGVAKYKITIKGIETNNGSNVVLAGACIGKDESSAATGQYWYSDAGSTFATETIKDGEVSFEFYGHDVPTDWKRSYGVGHGPEIKIYAEGGKAEETCLLQRGSGADNNFLFPYYAIATDGKLNDIELTIDVSKLANNEATVADPTIAQTVFKLNAIYIANASSLDTTNGTFYIAGADNGGNDKSKSSRAVADANSTWSAIVNKWGVGDGAIAVKDFTTADAFEYPVPTIDIAPQSSTFALGFRLVPSNSTDKNFADEWKNAVVVNTAWLSTSDYAYDITDNPTTYTLYYDAKAKYASLVPSSTITFESTCTIKNIILKNWTESWVPSLIGGFTSWGSNIEGTASADKTTYTYDVSSYTTAGVEFKFREGTAWDNGAGLGSSAANISCDSVKPASGNINLICTYTKGSGVSVSWEKVK